MNKIRFSNARIMTVALVFLCSFFITTFVKAQEPPTIYVSGDGTGDYNCNGTSDQIEINQALEFVATHSEYNTVYLKGSHTYLIDEPIIMQSNIHLTGDSNAKIKLIDNVASIKNDWNQKHGNKPMITQAGAEFWEGGNNYTGTWTDAIYGDGISTIENAEIDGFQLEIGTQDGFAHGKYWYGGMYFFLAKNLSIHDMQLSNSYTDMIRIMSNSNTNLNDDIHIYNININKTGHEGIYITRAKNIEINSNEITHTRTNIGIRLSDCTQITVNDNVIGNDLNSTPSGYAGIEVRVKNINLNHLDIYNNFIYGKAGGIVLRVKGTKDFTNLITDVRVHNNRLYSIFNNTAGSANYLNGGVHLHGFPNAIIENNVIDGSWKDGIVYEEYPGSVGTGYQTIVRNNIIRNSHGFGINDILGDSNKHKFIIKYNDLFNNEAGDYNNTNSTTDLHVDPLFVNAPSSYDSPINPENVDFHLKSLSGHWNNSIWINDAKTSPCIDAGDPNSDFSKEPKPSGKRINIGAYGNTANASKSIIRADVNKDGYINSIDAMLTLRKSLNLDMNETAWKPLNATGDVNCDNTVDITDANLILKHSIELSTSKWCG